eukprot:scaffold61234_cov41-Phaeocystis_antarctica.AAC.1
MKRDGAEVAPAHLERVWRTPQWGCSRRYQPCRRGDAPYRALSRSASSTLCRDAWRPYCCANWTRPALQCFPVPVCGPLYECDPHGIPPSDGVWTRESRVEGRRRPKKAEVVAEVADVVAICVQT